MARNLERDRPSTSTSFAARLRVDHDAGVLLQRDFFHLRAGTAAFLPGTGAPRRSLSTSVRRRKLSRPVGARTFVRHHRATGDDHGDLWNIGNPARAYGVG